jgi:UDP-glucose 4-epimerase
MQLGPLRLIIGNGKNHLPFTYVGNAVDSLLVAAISPQAIGQAYNVVDEPQVTVRDLIRQSSKITGERAIVIPVHPILLSGFARLLEWRSGSGSSRTTPKLSRFVISSACRNIRYDTQKSREQLGWQPAVTLEEGLQNSIGRRVVGNT